MDAELSKKIANLRLPLCLGVIAIHSYSPAMEMPDLLENGIVDFFAIYLPSVCVPVFFLISGYLLGYRHKICDRGEYLNLLKKRSVSLLLPYIVWNLLAFTVRLAVKKSPLGHLTSSVYSFDSPFDFLHDVLWTPELVPLWFVRNLMLFVAAYPIVLWLVKHFKAFSLLLIYCLDSYCDMGGLFYFAGGVWCACTLPEQGNSRLLHRLRWLLSVFVAGALLEAFTSLAIFNNAIFSSLWQLCGVLGVIAVCPGDKSHAPVSPGGVFFLYAVHGLLSPYIIKGMLMLCGDALPVVVIYFLCFGLIVTASYIAWLLCRRWPHRLLSLLTGSRQSASMSVI